MNSVSTTNVILTYRFFFVKKTPVYVTLLLFHILLAFYVQEVLGLIMKSNRVKLVFLHNWSMGTCYSSPSITFQTGFGFFSFVEMYLFRLRIVLLLYAIKRYLFFF